MCAEGTRKRKDQRALLVSLTFLAGLSFAFAIWWHEINVDPVFRIPQRHMPQPNAYDYFMKAYNSLVERDKIDQGASVSQQQTVVNKNAQSLALLRRGFAFEYRQPPTHSLHVTGEYTCYTKLRTLARLLVLDGYTKAFHGDWNGAVNAYLDAVRMGNDVPRGGPGIAMLVGEACEGMGRTRSYLWNVVDRLDAVGARNAARRVEDILAHCVPFAETLQGMKWDGQSELMELFRKPDWHKAAMEYIMDSIQNKEYVDSDLHWQDEIRVWFCSKRAVMANYTQYMDTAIAEARRHKSGMLNLPPGPDDPVNGLFTPKHFHFVEQMRFRYLLRSETWNAFLAVTLALRAYLLEHGRYPEKLDSLVPSYLKEVSDDPFADSGKLRYKLLGSKYLLYSVGPDGKDDGGKPIENPALTPRYIVEWNSKGDIVASINGD